MFNSNQRLNNRWRLDHKLPNLDRIERWIIWDLETEQPLELLSPTASENIQAEQPDHFLQTHRSNEKCIHCGLHDTQPFAIYPVPSSEFSMDFSIPSNELLSFTKTIQDQLPGHGIHLYPEEITIINGNISLRPLGQTFQQSNILVNPLQHPLNTTPIFSLAMMTILNQHHHLSWKDRNAFSLWLESFDVSEWFPDLPQEYQQWIQAAIRSENVPYLSTDKFSTELKPVQFEQRATNQVSVSTTISHATRDIPLPQHLIIAPAIASPSVAKQLSAISGIPIDITLHAFENKNSLILGGAETVSLATKEMERYTNVPITLTIQEKSGPFGHQVIRIGLTGSILGGLALTVFGLGWLPLGIGTGIWAMGNILQSRQQTHNANLWKSSQRVGVQNTSAVDAALQSARKRVLTSDLPSLAVRDFIKQIDSLDENSPQSPQQTIDMANQIYIQSKNIDSGLKKSIRQTEDLVNSSIQ